MSGPCLDPRIAAIWVVHGRACANLLRAHGREQHADNYELALDELMEILAEGVGRARLTAAIDWVSDELWSDDATPDGQRTRN